VLHKHEIESPDESIAECQWELASLKESFRHETWCMKVEFLDQYALKLTYEQM
jgi:hypothetical protein